MKIFKIGLPIILALVMFGTLGAGFANAQAATTCTPRVDLTAAEASDLLGKTHSGVTGGTPLTLIGPTAGDNGLLCTYALIKFITELVFLIVLVVSVLMLAYSSFLFVTAGARPDQVASAKNVLVYAIVGLIVAALARVIPAVIRGVIGI